MSDRQFVHGIPHGWAAFLVQDNHLGWCMPPGGGMLLVWDTHLEQAEPFVGVVCSEFDFGIDLIESGGDVMACLNYLLPPRHSVQSDFPFCR